MTSILRDTQAGLLIRFLSGNKLLRYPDEIDPSLWKKFQKEHLGDSDTPENANLEKTESKSSGAATTTVTDTATPPQNHDSQELKDNHSAEAGKDEFLVDWYGPDDGENPQNWSRTQKLLVATQICLLNWSVYMASSIYAPAEISAMADFHSSEIVATLGLSLFTLGYGIGPMLWSPMSEMPRFGRSGIYFWTLLFFVLFQLPTGYAVNMAMFLVFRFITGVFGSPTLSTGGATMMDMYDMGAASIAIPIWGAFAIISPCLGPVLGGFVSPVKGWSWSIWMIVWLTTFVLVTMFFFNPETSAANILYRRAARRRQATGDPRFKSQSEIDAATHTLKDDMIVLGRAFSLIFTEPIVFVMDLYVALIYGVLFIWFESFPLVFGGVYHFNLGEQGLAFFGILVGTTITVIAYCLWVIYILIPKFSDPTFKPEVVLPPVWFGSLSLPICLFFYGWTARASIHWIVPIIATTLFGVPLVVVFQSCLNYLAISYPTYAASIFAGNGLFRSIFGAIFPLFARQLFRGLGIGGGNSLLGGISICFIPIPFLLYYRGVKIRHASKNARHDI
ncbi:Caffeine resistance protein [Lachnellula hyalina]|uniref:Caffeine resistance protein n=1 Tax=Lachnellula hyalina TaxID=1316788 RepID=A0A8H8QWS5_9HELO|nr:Caffeine resistance protein [Lachnellula hyalina]TVY23600.1 Caffeine resistance protein [Lachnellula hyalina]